LKKLDNKVISDLKSIIHNVKSMKTNINEPSGIGTTGSKRFTYNGIVHTIEDDSGNVDQIYKNGAIKLNVNTPVHKVSIFDENRKRIDGVQGLKNMVDIDTCHCFISSIIEFNSIVITESNNICVYIKPHQLKVSQCEMKQYNLGEYSFVDSEQDKMEKVEKPISTATECMDDISQSRSVMIDQDILKSALKLNNSKTDVKPVGENNTKAKINTTTNIGTNKQAIDSNTTDTTDTTNTVIKSSMKSDIIKQKKQLGKIVEEQSESDDSDNSSNIMELADHLDDEHNTDDDDDEIDNVNRRKFFRV